MKLLKSDWHLVFTIWSSHIILKTLGRTWDPLRPRNESYTWKDLVITPLSDNLFIQSMSDGSMDFSCFCVSNGSTILLYKKCFFISNVSTKFIPPDAKVRSNAVGLDHPRLDICHLLPRDADVQLETFILPRGEGRSHPLSSGTLGLQLALELVKYTLKHPKMGTKIEGVQNGSTNRGCSKTRCERLLNPFPSSRPIWHVQIRVALSLQLFLFFILDTATLAFLLQCLNLLFIVISLLETAGAINSSNPLTTINN